jgi:hypothetical protein
MSERSLLDAYFQAVEGKHLVRLVRKYFPAAQIVADRFHMIRLVNHHFLSCWRDLDAVGSREPRIALSDAPSPAQPQASALEVIYRFKLRLCYFVAGKAPHPQTVPIAD